MIFATLIEIFSAHCDWRLFGMKMNGLLKYIFYIFWLCTDLVDVRNDFQHPQVFVINKFLDINFFLSNWQNLSLIDGFLLCFYCQFHSVMTFIMLFEVTWYFKWTLLQLNIWKKSKTSKDKYRQVILVFCYKSFQNFLWRTFVSVCPTSTVPSCIYTFVTPHKFQGQMQVFQRTGA